MCELLCFLCLFQLRCSVITCHLVNMCCVRVDDNVLFIFLFEVRCSMHLNKFSTCVYLSPLSNEKNQTNTNRVEYFDLLKRNKISKSSVWRQIRIRDGIENDAAFRNVPLSERETLFIEYRSSLGAVCVSVCLCVCVCVGVCV